MATKQAWQANEEVTARVSTNRQKLNSDNLVLFFLLVEIVCLFNTFSIIDVNNSARTWGNFKIQGSGVGKNL